MFAYGTTGGMWAAYGIAALLGAIGGIVAELMLRGQAGQLEKPRGHLVRFWDLGFWANIVIGAAAAVGFLLFLEPSTVGTGAKAHQVYQAEVLISTSLIVGTVGGAILSAMAERVKAAISGKKVEDLVKEQIAALESILPKATDGTISTNVAPETEITVTAGTVQAMIAQLKATSTTPESEGENV